MSKIADFFVELGLKKDKFDKGIDDVGGSASKLGGAFKLLGGAIGAAFSVGAILTFNKAAMEAWDQQMKAEAGLLQALKGREMVQKALIQQAGELQRKTLFGDEVTVEAQKMLALMGLSATQIKDLIPLVQDFAQATGMDLAGAANLVAKTVGSSTNALGRYGVEIDSTASKAEKAAAVMAVFTDRYGGQAEKAAKVGVSGLQQLKGAWGDIMEVIGSKVGPFMSALSKLLSGKLLDAASGTSATGLQKTVDEYLNADEAGRKKIVSGLEYTLAEYNRLWLEAIEKNDEKNRSHWALQMDYTREAINEINKLNSESAAVVEVSEEDKRAAWDKSQAKLRETGEIAQEVSETMRQSMLSALDLEMTKPVDYKLKPIDLTYDEEVSDEDPAWLTKLGEDLIKAKESWDNFSNEMSAAVSDFAANVIGTLFEDIGEAIVAGGGMQQSLNDILSMFGDFIGQLGKMMIAYGTAALGFSLLGKNPNPASAIALIAAGAAMTAIGGMIKASMKSGVSGTGMTGTSGGYNQGFDSSDFGAESSLVAEVSGDSLRFLLERSNRNKKRVM